MKRYARWAKVLYGWKINKSVDALCPPEEVFLEITNTCNFKCSYCPHAEPNHFLEVSPATMSPDDVLLLLGKLRDGGVTTSAIHLNIDGEPFMNRRIDQICSAAISKGWNTFIFATNGYYASAERVNALPAAGKDVRYLFTIDFCSDRVLFERYRGGTGSWDVVRQNVHDLISLDIPHVSIVMTDISSFVITDRRELLSRYAALKQLFPDSKRLGFKTREFHDVTAYVTGQVNGSHEHRKYNECPYPWTSIHIAANGDVISCDRDLRHKNVLGNLFTENFSDIWNGEKYRRLRNAILEGDLADMGACPFCDLPYDSSKFSLRHLAQVAVVRLGAFSMVD
ncbi:radical SAM/SPASM domain-containing protein [Pelodictyon luteolum]|uniref:Fe-S oxidoreductases-like protein n=1 Tax=Chlorobium luteolum (strain DSM 273 / BCRC 81028 / 2530) TaxID=319225 RepID=Q3B4T2_CHLL3|nr:radical SAM/SPASM domain-containing protein [Pelodictyon luteolum]ABB23649.1 Fe-S oxidoreductases-like protein [Pelodictyon luteolum DSM 273]